MRFRALSMFAVGASCVIARDVIAMATRGRAPQQDSVARARADSIAYAERVTIQRLDAAARAAAVRRRRADTTRLTTQIEAALPTAFADPAARRLLERARAARLLQDSALQAYSVRETQRTTVRMGIGNTGPKRTIMRADNVAQVEWKRGSGARVTPLGSRMTSDFARVQEHAVDMVSIPYFPGRDQLWMPMGTQLVRTNVDEYSLVHPVARGAEAYYRYATGDSVDIRLPDGRTISIRELRITARRPEWRAFVGSFWFDTGSGLLVRAVYRLAAELETGNLSGDPELLDAEVRAEYARLRDSSLRATLPPDAVSRDSAKRAKSGNDGAPKMPAFLKPFMPPSRARIESITTEYGLYEGRFWLPRVNSLEATAEAGFFRIPVEMHEKYAYDHVNGSVDLPPDTVTRARGNPLRCTGIMVGVSVCETPLDTAANRRRAERLRGDSAARCAVDSTFTRTSSTGEGAVALSYRMPCRSVQLRNSPLLPAADAPTDPLFDSPSRDELLRLLDMGLQPAWSPQLPKLHSGLGLARYNRVEGFSAGVRADQQLGAGYSLSALGRIGHADLHANGELSLSRTNLRRTLTAAVYHRLSPVNPEWTGDLSFRTSLPALLYARDDAFYLRNMGVEVVDRRESHDGVLGARLFAERQWTAGDSGVRNTFALLGPDFQPNIVADRASQAGVSVDASRGFEPRLGITWRMAARAEAATGTFDYVKGALELGATRDLGVLGVSLSSSVGTSGGTVPSQRLWYLGGLRTVRGELAGAQRGNAFWLTRSEVALRSGIVRPVVFFDAGWSGARDKFGLSDMQKGAGVGASFFNGLIRADLARGLGSRKKWRFDVYLQAPL